MTDYHQNDPTMIGYAVEITHSRAGMVFGNIFEVGHYSDYARHIRDTALPLDSVTLTYSNDWGVNAGKTITVPRREYDNDRHRLMSESGRVTTVRFNPASEAELTALLQREHSRRMAYPIGSQEEHLKKLTDKLAEVRKPAEELSPPEKAVKPPAAKKKQSITARLAEADAEAKAFNAQRAQNPATATKKHKKEIE